MFESGHRWIWRIILVFAICEVIIQFLIHGFGSREMAMAFTSAAIPIIALEIIDLKEKIK